MIGTKEFAGVERRLQQSARDYLARLRKARRKTPPEARNRRLLLHHLIEQVRAMVRFLDFMYRLRREKLWPRDFKNFPLLGRGEYHYQEYQMFVLLYAHIAMPDMLSFNPTKIKAPGRYWQTALLGIINEPLPIDNEVLPRLGDVFWQHIMTGP